MSDDILLNQGKLFDRYYHDALAIRAICDDMDFPAEYSPVFVNIHIKGIDYFKDMEKKSRHYEQVFHLLSPQIEDHIKQDSNRIKPEIVKKLLSKICIGKKIEQLDAYLEQATGVSGFLSNQLKNQKRLYLEEEFREHMLALYFFFVQPYISSYTDEKIQQAFYRGRLKDLNREIGRSRESGPGQELS